MLNVESFHSLLKLKYGATNSTTTVTASMTLWYLRTQTIWLPYEGCVKQCLLKTSRKRGPPEHHHFCGYMAPWV